MAFQSKPVKDVTAFLQEARDRHAYALQLDAEDRAQALDDVRFAAALPIGDGGTTQWSPEAIKRRKDANRPVLTENRMPIFINQVVNDGRQSKPSIRIPAGRERN